MKFRNRIHNLAVIAAASLCFIVLTCIVPTGWIYDIGVGQGTEQGQWAVGDIRKIQTAGDTKEAYRQNMLLTITGDTFVACPMLRIRSQELVGTHYVRRRSARRQYRVDEYWTMAYPVPLWHDILSFCIAGGMYNRYYLHKLEDNSFLCVYFDDYLMIKRFLFGNSAFPVGYVRRTSAKEQGMLRKMQPYYNVDILYVLDMYKYGKQPGWLDMLLRLAFGFAVMIVAYFAANRYRLTRRLF